MTRAPRKAPAMLNAAQAAHYLGIAYITFYRWRQTGELDSITRWTPGRQAYWLAEELDDWVRRTDNLGSAS